MWAFPAWKWNETSRLFPWERKDAFRWLPRWGRDFLIVLVTDRKVMGTAGYTSMEGVWEVDEEAIRTFGHPGIRFSIARERVRSVTAYGMVRLRIEVAEGVATEFNVEDSIQVAMRIRRLWRMKEAAWNLLI